MAQKQIWENFENDSLIYSTDFPSPLIPRKFLLSPDNFDWETTKTQIIISYKHPPQTKIINQNIEEFERINHYTEAETHFFSRKNSNPMENIRMYDW